MEMEKATITGKDSEKYNIVCVSYIRNKGRVFVVSLSAEDMPDIKAIIKYEESSYYPDIFYPRTDFRLTDNVELSFEARHKLIINVSRTMSCLVSVT